VYQYENIMELVTDKPANLSMQSMAYKNNFTKNGFIQSCSHCTIRTVHSLPPATVYCNSMWKFNVAKLMENTSLSVFHCPRVPIYGLLTSPVQRFRNHIIRNTPYLTIVSSCKSQETIAFSLSFA
jgi:hypothetical protein